MTDTCRVEAIESGSYRERALILAAFARSVRAQGFTVGIGVDPAYVEDPEWRNVLFIDLPTGQVSWHIQASDMDLFDGLPVYAKPWDGHSTEKKFVRLHTADFQVV